MVTCQNLTRWGKCSDGYQDPSMCTPCSKPAGVAPTTARVAPPSPVAQILPEIANTYSGRGSLRDFNDVTKQIVSRRNSRCKGCGEEMHTGDYIGSYPSAIHVVQHHNGRLEGKCAPNVVLTWVCTKCAQAAKDAIVTLIENESIGYDIKATNDYVNKAVCVTGRDPSIKAGFRFDLRESGPIKYLSVAIYRERK